MTECTNCGTIHGTKTYQENDRAVTYCVECSPADAKTPDDGYRVVEYPDRRDGGTSE